MQTNPDLIASDGLWSSIEPCPELVELISSTPNATVRLGNFTEVPEPSVIRTCTRNNGIYILDGDELADALAEPTPLLKVCCEELGHLCSEGVHGPPLWAAVLVMLTDQVSQTAVALA